MIRLGAFLLLVTGLGALHDSVQSKAELSEILDYPSPTPPAPKLENSSQHKAGGSARRRFQAQQGKRGRKFPRRVPLRRHPPMGCEQFSWPEGSKSLAIVGNGPLSSKDRQEIQAGSSRNSPRHYKESTPHTVMPDFMSVAFAPLSQGGWKQARPNGLHM